MRALLTARVLTPLSSSQQSNGANAEPMAFCKKAMRVDKLCTGTAQTSSAHSLTHSSASHPDSSDDALQ